MTDSTPMLGSVVWWEVFKINLTHSQFAEILERNGIDKKYAKKHNYRSSIIRALRKLEDDRIIRKVTENHLRLVYQLTTEVLMDEFGEDPSLEYEKEGTIEIDKEMYSLTNDIRRSLTCHDAFKDNLVEWFEEAAQSYNSSDLTRYIQNIFSGEADIIPLRQQGAVYFVPVDHQDIVDKVAAVLAEISDNDFGCAVFRHLDVPDIERSKDMIREQFVADITEVLGEVEKDLNNLERDGKEVTDKWYQTRTSRLKAASERIKQYNNLVGIEDEHSNACQRLLKEINSKS